MDTEQLAQSFQALFPPDALTTVTLVKPFAKSDPLVLSEPVTGQTARAPDDLLLVKLIVGPGYPGPPEAPSTSPGIGIEVWLPRPDRWDGRVHTIGGLGGFDGGDHAAVDKVGWFYAALTAAAEGSVSASTDSGHTPRNGAWAMGPDGKAATQLWIDFTHRAQHEMAVKTKALAAAYYERAPHHSYYEGVSTGGRHGYRLVQQYPDDYDGVIGNLSAMNWTEWVISNLYRKLVVQRDRAGVALSEGQLDLVSNAAIAACDMVGGEHLGYIMDNAACRYDPTQDPEVLVAADGGTGDSPDRVTLAQAQALNKMWYGPTVDGSVPDPVEDNGAGPELADGHLWFGLARGTSLYNAHFTKQDPFMREVLQAMARTGDDPGADQVALILDDPSIAGPQFRNATGQGQARWREMSYAELAAAFRRGLEREADFAHLASDNPDLSAFKARGGKFLSWHGWNDEAIPVQGTIRYYERVMAAMGGAKAVQGFFKLYLVPGGGHMSPHGTSNPEANPPMVAQGQFYRLLVDWVENGIEPGRIEVRSPSPHPVEIVQPLYPYPGKATYVGGDPRKAESYEGA